MALILKLPELVFMSDSKLLRDFLISTTDCFTEPEIELPRPDSRLDSVNVILSKMVWNELTNVGTPVMFDRILNTEISCTLKLDKAPDLVDVILVNEVIIVLIEIVIEIPMLLNELGNPIKIVSRPVEVFSEVSLLSLSLPL